MLFIPGACVALTSEDLSGRGRDLALGQDARGYLVQQRLEQVMGGPVDQRDLDLGTLEGLRGEQTAEPGADDHHPVSTANLGVRGALIEVGALSSALSHEAKRTQAQAR